MQMSMVTEPKRCPKCEHEEDVKIVCRYCGYEYKYGEWVWWVFWKNIIFTCLIIYICITLYQWMSWTRRTTYEEYRETNMDWRRFTLMETFGEQSKWIKAKIKWFGGLKIK